MGTRIKLDMNISDAAYSLAEDDEKALDVLAELYDKNKGIAYWLTLDNHNIYGTQIHKLFDQCCAGDVDKLVLSIKLIQYGAFTQQQIEHNLTREKALPFVDDAIILPQSAYDREQGDVLDRIEFWDYVKAQTESFKTRTQQAERE